MENNFVICVVEDNAPIRKLFCTMLKKAGLETVDFGDGFSALSWLKNNPVNGILLDILLPDINGNDLLKKIKEIEYHKNTPVIAVTGFAQSQDRDKYLNEGFTHYLSKPVNTATFVNDIKQLFKV